MARAAEKAAGKARWMNWKLLLAVFICLGALGIGCVAGLNAYVRNIGERYIVSPETAADLDQVDCIIVLGCFVRQDGTPSDMLQDRLVRGIQLYQAGAAPKLLMSGDHGRPEYNEVGAMKQYALQRDVPSGDIFMDHAGFSTYDTMYRAKEIFGVRKAIIVTQEYHLYRALYIARALGIEAYGVSADYNTYRGQVVRECREILARCKDAALSVFQPAPTCLGDALPIQGDGNITNDAQMVSWLQQGAYR